MKPAGGRAAGEKCGFNPTPFSDEFRLIIQLLFSTGGQQHMWWPSRRRQHGAPSSLTPAMPHGSRKNSGRKDKAVNVVVLINNVVGNHVVPVRSRHTWYQPRPTSHRHPTHGPPCSSLRFVLSCLSELFTRTCTVCSYNLPLHDLGCSNLDLPITKVLICAACVSCRLFTAWKKKHSHEAPIRAACDGFTLLTHGAQSHAALRV